ncbi:MAG: 2-oxoacid:acceptor oxidoreductase family protein [Planctomycetota bacterium]
MRHEIRICGFGGQGIILAGVILGEAAAKSGYQAVQTQSYGPESRGGAARSEVVVSDAPIDYPRVTSADVIVALSQPAFDKYAGELGADGYVVVDSAGVEADGVTALPFTKTAEAVGHKIVTNIVMLGYLGARLDFVDKDILEATVLANVPKGTEEINVKALAAGRDLAAEVVA